MPKPPLSDPLVPDCRLAGELGISRLTVWRWRKRGILPPAVVVGGRNFTRLSVVEHLKAHGDGSLPQQLPRQPKKEAD